MTKKKIHVACSPLTGTIYAGKPLKDGLWGNSKDDVTDSAVRSVAVHLLVKKESLVFEFQGKKYILKIEELKP
jgi:hypothetical protein